MFVTNDVILIRAKLKEDGMTVKNLAAKIKTSPNKLERLLCLKEESILLEERVLRWLKRN